MKVLVLGAGISGHTAASFLKKKLGKKHDVIVVSPSLNYMIMKIVVKGHS